MIEVEGNKKIDTKSIFTNKKRLAVIIIVLFLVLVSYFIYFRFRPSPNIAPEPYYFDGVEDYEINSYSVTGTKEITFSEVLMPESGFIILYEDINGNWGNVVGSSDVLLKGRNKDVVAIARRDLVDGEKIYAVIHTDDGNSYLDFPGDGDETEQFEYEGGDFPIKNNAGDLTIVEIIVDLP